MPYALEWQRVVALIVAACIIGVAAAVFAFRPHARANRRLALMLTAEATGLGAGWSLGMMATDPTHAAAWITLGWAAYAALVPLYVLFLATLSTPLARPLSSKPGTYILGALAVIGPLLVLARTDWFFYELRPRVGTGTFLQTPGPLGIALPAIHALPLPILGLVLALYQWTRAAAGSLARQQAGAYAVAFGWRDASRLVLLLVLPLAAHTSITDSDPFPTLIYGLMDLGFMVLVVYGILSTQLFDIDVKARLVIRQSTFLAVAGALFFVVSELTEQLLSFEGILPALLWAALIALAFRPLQKLSRRVATRALPLRTASEDAARKLLLYEAAASGFQLDGAVTAREAAVLARMRERLGITEADVAGLATRTGDPRRPQAREQHPTA